MDENKERNFPLKISRRDFLKVSPLLAAGTVATVYGWTQGWFDLFPPARDTRKILKKAFILKGVSPEQEILLRQGVEAIFKEPTPKEINWAFDYYNKTVYRSGTRQDNVYSFYYQTPDGIEEKCLAAIDPDAIERGEINWLIDGTPPSKFDSGKLNTEIGIPGEIPEKGKASIFPTVLIGEPHQFGVNQDISVFQVPSLSAILELKEKGLTGVGFLKLLKEGQLGINLPQNKILKIVGGSGGANGALTVVTHLPEEITELFTFAGFYDFFHPSLKTQILDILNGKDTSPFLENIIYEIEDILKLNPQTGPDFINEQFLRIRQIMLLASPYYWVDKIKPNSFNWWLIHGRNDQFTPLNQADELARKLAGYGWNKDHLKIFFHDGGHTNIGNGLMTDPSIYR